MFQLALVVLAVAVLAGILGMGMMGVGPGLAAFDSTLAILSIVLLVGLAVLLFRLGRSDRPSPPTGR